MANPQKENGYTAIANEILQELIRAGLNGTELACVLFIIRKTYGFKKKQDKISISQFKANIPFSKRAICYALNRLQRVQVIAQVKKGISKKEASTYCFNKNYEEWNCMQKIAHVQNLVPTCAIFGNKPVQKIAHTKESITKEKKTKENAQARDFDRKGKKEKNLTSDGYDLEKCNERLDKWIDNN